MPAGDHARLLKNLLGSKVTKKKKTKKYRKIPKANWFERLTVEEIKQLCKAAKLPVSGSKGDIVSRLLDSESTSHFGSESRAGGFSFTTGTFRPGKDGVSVEDLKEEMRKRSLSVTGSKHQLVLRLLQHEHGTGGAAAEGPKRAAAAANAADTTNAYDAEGNSVLTTTTTTTTTKAQPKPRKPKAPARPNVEKLRERMEKKIYPASKSSWSDYKYKEHANDVCQLASNLVRAEAAKGFAATRDPVLLDACIAVVRPILEAGNVRGVMISHHHIFI